MAVLRTRARMLSAIRRFFADRGVLEVETPVLGQAIGTDPNLNFFSTRFRKAPTAGEIELYLQTSPEFAMKRLLAAGSGCIYQICKAFRNEESGRLHNPEFTLLEWYRVGFSLEQLMDEVEQLLRALLSECLALHEVEHLSYREVFLHHTNIDPLSISIADFTHWARRSGYPEAPSLCGEQVSNWLDFLFSHSVQPRLGRGRLTFIYDYPARQAALARLKSTQPPVAERFEVFLQGVELANGFHELTDPIEQRRRFERELDERQQNGQPLPAKDERLLEALRAGLPDCSGVALGLDRVLMLLVKAASIDEVLAFPLARA